MFLCSAWVFDAAEIRPEVSHSTVKLTGDLNNHLFQGRVAISNQYKAVGPLPEENSPLTYIGKGLEYNFVKSYPDVRKDTANWIALADYDVETARHMLATKRYLYVIFLCHLALEKIAEGARR